MKQKLLKLTAFLLLLTGLASSCNTECPPDCPDEYPKNISFTEYTLLETSCQWQNLPYDEKVIIINSSEELEKYISCTEGGYPAVDFSKHSLLLTSGKLNNGIASIAAKKLQQLSSNKYELSIEAEVYSSILHKWISAILVDKLSEENYVELKVNCVEVEVYYPIDIAFEEYSLLDPSCQKMLSSFGINKITVINSNRELENYIVELKNYYVCPDDSYYPEINFSEYSLICARGMASSSPADVISTQLLQISENEYSLNLIIRPGPLLTPGRWLTSIKIYKLSQNATVTLNTEIFGL